jgi:hypothetical protein
MTPTEFKAWFEGFCEAIDAAPTPEQWAKIKAKAAEMGGPVMRIDRPDLDRQRGVGVWSPNTSGTSGEPLPDRGRVIAQNASGLDFRPLD